MIYRRNGSGVLRETEPFRPWLIAKSAEDIAGFHREYETWQLEGEGYSVLVAFPAWGDFQEARQFIKHKGKGPFFYSDPVRQHLMLTGKTLFKGMTHIDPHRLAFDIETAGFTPDAPESRILMIALCDSRGYEETILSDSEAEILERFAEAVLRLDPDILEGHNLFGFDIPYIASRADRLGVKLPLGRDGSPFRFEQQSHYRFGGNSLPYTPCRLFGRHIIDTLHQVQRWDRDGKLESYALKEVAVMLGLSSEDRTYVDRRNILKEWKRDPGKVAAYALDDVRETRALSDLVTPTEFYQTQIVPDTYQDVATSGTGEKVNLLLVREYLREGLAIPVPQPPRDVIGGYTEVREAGVFHRVVKADAESLYPSIMLRFGIKPQSDTLDIFLPLLKELTRRRIEAKQNAREGEGAQRHYWNAIQASFKILINSFYGYLGYSRACFNDYDAAERITTKGQEIVRQIDRLLGERGCRVIEIDTDGVYFVPPEAVRTEGEEKVFIDAIGGALPEGIRLAHDGRYRVMISLKAKNYVLFGYDGKTTVKGSALRSRRDEIFGREFLTEAMSLLAEGHLEEASALYHRIGDDIREGRLPKEKFVRWESVTEKTFSSDAKRRFAEAARDARIGQKIAVYQRNDGSIARIEDYRSDEDREYLLRRLHDFAKRLEPALGSDTFALRFPRITLKPARVKAADLNLSLFGDEM
ncbi:MAG: ribonuclease H-like domain-containing protein [Armatimonadetes bacterium]|nr:ribonuclease H-like domain-containing protein [Armatimonadota bacterium]